MPGQLAALARTGAEEARLLHVAAVVSDSSPRSLFRRGLQDREDAGGVVPPIVTAGERRDSGTIVLSLQDIDKRRGECPWLSRRNKTAKLVLAHEVRDPTNIRRDYRSPTGECLNQRVRCSL